MCSEAYVCTHTHAHKINVTKNRLHRSWARRHHLGGPEVSLREREPLVSLLGYMRWRIAKDSISPVRMNLLQGASRFGIATVESVARLALNS